MLKNKPLNLVTLVIFFSFQVQPGLAEANSPPRVLGQIVSQDVQIDGVAVASGTTLLNGSLVESGRASTFVHMVDGSVIEMAQESSAQFRDTGLDTIQIEVHRGALRFQEEGGETVIVPGETQTRQTRTQPGEPGQGLVAALTRDGPTGATKLEVNDTNRIASTSPILLVSPDGKIREIHYLKSVKNKEIELTAGLQVPFPIQSLIYQGDRIDPAVATGTPIVGTVVAGGGKGVSKTAVLLIVVGGGAAAGAAFAFSQSGGDGGGSPPATPVTP